MTLPIIVAGAVATVLAIVYGAVRISYGRGIAEGDLRLRRGLEKLKNERTKEGEDWDAAGGFGSAIERGLRKADPGSS